MSDGDKTNRLFELLRWRHRDGYQWASFVELASSTGGPARRIDFFAINCYWSKKYLAIAYEVKVSRGDFLKELKCPEKRAFAESVSHQSYFVTPERMIKLSEVPDGWGLIEQRGYNLRIIKLAPRRPKVNWDMNFMVSIARRSADPVPRQAPFWLEPESEALT